MNQNDNSRSGACDTVQSSPSVHVRARLRMTGKRWLKTAMMRSGVLNLASRMVRQRVVVLHYHSVQDGAGHVANALVPGTVHSSSLFQEQMELVARRYNPVSMPEVLQFLRGEMELPSRPVAVTFDDGYADNFEIVAPILDRLGIRALFNVMVDSIEAPSPPWFCRLHHAFQTTRLKSWSDSAAHCVHPLVERAERWAAFLLASQQCARSARAAQATIVSAIEQELCVEPLQPEACPMMTWEQLRGLLGAGHIVGSHSLSHPNLAYVDDETQWNEISQSKIQLENQLRTQVDHFSYPNPIMDPNFNERTIHWTRQAGYKLATTGISGPVRFGDDPFTVHRIPAPSVREEFIWYVENTFLGRRL